jgi:hypothetical protein
MSTSSARWESWVRDRKLRGSFWTGRALFLVTVTALSSKPETSSTLQNFVEEGRLNELEKNQ